LEQKTKEGLLPDKTEDRFLFIRKSKHGLERDLYILESIRINGPYIFSDSGKSYCGFRSWGFDSFNISKQDS
jgi:hypothetical protein